MISEICDAIRNKKLLEFLYNGNHRIVEPHAYGITSKGNELLRAYQIEGTSSGGKVPDWVLFSVSRINNLKTLNRYFARARHDYRKNDSAMAEIHYQL